MSKKILNTAFQPYLLDVLEKMKNEHDWDIFYSFYVEDTETRIKTLFPSAIHQHFNDAIKGRHNSIIHEINVIPNDDELIRKMSQWQSITLSMMDRNDMLNCFKFNERLEHYYELLKYWNTIISHYKPDIIFHETLPHEAHDYVIYKLAELKGIQQVIFSQTFFLDRITVMSSFEKGHELINHKYAESIQNWDGSPVKISDKCESMINKINGKYEENLRFDMKDFMIQVNRMDSKLSFRKISNIFLNTLKFFNIFKFEKRLKAIISLFEISEHNIFKRVNHSLPESNMSKLELRYFTRKALKKKQLLYKYYHKIANDKIDLNIPFIYCPLHFQPEATTSPLGDYFVSQYLMVEMLSRNLPHGWKLYVKDHLGQFVYSVWGESSRSKSYYDKIVQLPNIELIPIKLDSYTIIDKCKAVATITGTVSLESVLRGKCVLSFGHNLNYENCDGVFSTKNNVDLVESLSKIKAGYLPDINKIKIYIDTVEKNSYRGGIGTIYNNGFENIFQKDNADGHYNAMINHLNKI